MDCPHLLKKRKTAKTSPKAKRRMPITKNCRSTSVAVIAVVFLLNICLLQIAESKPCVNCNKKNQQLDPYSQDNPYNPAQSIGGAPGSVLQGGTGSTTLQVGTESTMLQTGT